MKNLLPFLMRQSFQPGFFGFLINPFFLIRAPLFKKIELLSKQLKGNLLDFGCGRKPYENLFVVDSYVGVDVRISGHDHRNSKIDVFYDGKVLPFPDECFDSLISFEVLEHVFNPDQIMLELNRVLKTNGRILISVPFCWNEHEIPFDYARYSSFGIKSLLERHGFDVLEVHKTGNFFLVIIQLVILSIFELFKPLRRAGFVLTLLFSIPLSLIGFVVWKIPVNNPEMYFNTVILAKKRK